MDGMVSVVFARALLISPTTSLLFAPEIAKAASKETELLFVSMKIWPSFVKFVGAVPVPSELRPHVLRLERLPVDLE